MFNGSVNRVARGRVASLTPDNTLMRSHAIEDGFELVEGNTGSSVPSSPKPVASPSSTSIFASQLRAAFTQFEKDEVPLLSLNDCAKVTERLALIHFANTSSAKQVRVSTIGLPADTQRREQLLNALGRLFDPSTNSHLEKIDLDFSDEFAATHDLAPDGQSSINSAQMHHLVKVINSPRLHALNLNGCRLNVKSVEMLLHGLNASNQLAHLDLGTTGLDKQSVKKIAAQLSKLPGLQSLRLSGNLSLSTEGTRELIDALARRPLLIEAPQKFDLDLSHCAIEHLGTELLNTAVVNQIRLKISGNPCAKRLANIYTGMKKGVIYWQ